MHFSVGVITKNGTDWEIEKLLRPFHSDSFDSSYVYETKEVFIKGKREQYQIYLSSEDYLAYLRDKKSYCENKRIFKGLKRALSLNDDEFLAYVKKAEKISKKCFDNDDNFLYLYNSREAFDAWVVGGRFEGFLRLKDGSRSCFANMEDIVWKSDEKRIQSFRDVWSSVVEQNIPIKDRGTELYSKTKEDLLRIYGNESNFLKAYAMMAPKCLLTPSGKWIYPVFSRTENLITPTAKEVSAFHKVLSKYSDYTMTIVDCYGVI